MGTSVAASPPAKTGELANEDEGEEVFDLVDPSSSGTDELEPEGEAASKPAQHSLEQ